MHSQEVVYSVSKVGYSPTTRPSQHESLVQARQRDARLPYTTCHEVYKGPSHFVDPKLEELARPTQCTGLNKDLRESQVTVDCTQIAEELNPGRGLKMRRAYNSGSVMLRTEGNQGDEVESVFSKSGDGFMKRSLDWGQMEHQDRVAKESRFKNGSEAGGRPICRSLMQEWHDHGDACDSVDEEGTGCDGLGTGMSRDWEILTLHRLLMAKQKELMKVKQSLHESLNRQQALRQKLNEQNSKFQ